MTQLVAKTRMAPLKKLTIPRLELSAAELLAKLTHQIMHTMKIEFQNICLWSDSKIVLAWIKGGSKEMENVCIYQNNKNTAINWHHIRGEDNPADCASRGLSPNELIQHDLWWNGPRFLRELDYKCDEGSYDTNEEMKLNVCTTLKRDIFTLPQASSFGKLRRIMAYVLRFVDNCKGKGKYGHLTLNEIRSATTYIEKLLQNQYFEEEITALKSGKNVQ